MRFISALLPAILVAKHQIEEKRRYFEALLEFEEWNQADSTFFQELAVTYPCIAVDPDPDNTRAVATYAKAGFRATKVCPCEDGEQVQVMIFRETQA